MLSAHVIKTKNTLYSSTWPEGARGGGGGVLNIMNGRSRMTIERGVGLIDRRQTPIISHAGGLHDCTYTWCKRLRKMKNVCAGYMNELGACTFLSTWYMRRGKLKTHVCCIHERTGDLHDCTYLVQAKWEMKTCVCATLTVLVMTGYTL